MATTVPMRGDGRWVALLALVFACGDSQPAMEQPTEIPVVEVRPEVERARPEEPIVETDDPSLEPMPPADAKLISPLDPKPVKEAAPVIERTQTTAPQPTTLVVKGTGSCRVDEDCVLTGYREGCCTPSCEPYATSKRNLDARRARESCDAYRRGDKVCPPPAPCPRPTTRAVAATCHEHVCTALLEPLSDPNSRVRALDPASEAPGPEAE